MEFFLLILLLILLISTACVDLAKHKIPNKITFPAIITALLCHSIFSGWEGILFSLGGIAAGIALLIVPYLMGGMGAGDAKLMGAIGAIIGAKAAIVAFLFSALAGGVYAIVLILIRRDHFRGFFGEISATVINLLIFRKYFPQPENSVRENRPRLCYGLAIALGTGFYIALKLSGYDISNL